MTFNNQMKLPGSYFAQMARRDYRNWNEALIRELTQNSVDAGATKIDVSWDEETRLLTFKDNGCGMTKDILENAFLQFGASHKADGAVGGMGKAKELIIASWPSWSIKTNGIVATGSHNEYNLGLCAFNQGTEIALQVTSEMYLTLDTIRNFFYKCHITATVTINGDVYTGSTWTRGQVGKIEEFGKLYKGSHSDAVCYVRANGVFMFSEWVGDGNIPFIFEISNSATCMSAGRDGFVGDYYNKYSKLVREMNFNASGFKEYKAEIDFMVADNDEKTDTIENIFQNSPVTIDASQDFTGAMDQAIESHAHAGPVVQGLRAPVQYVPKVNLNIKNISNEELQTERGQEIIASVQRRAKLDDADRFTKMTGFYSKFLHGRFLFRTTDLTKESQKYMTTTKSALINFLFFGVVKEVAKLMADKLESPKNFVVGGFVDKDSEDEAICIDQKILLNLGKISKCNFDEELLAKLIGLACHEVCHFQESHNERMAGLLTQYLPLLFTVHYPRFKAIFKKVKQMKPIFKAEIERVEAEYPERKQYRRKSMMVRRETIRINRPDPWA